MTKISPTLSLSQSSCTQNRGHLIGNKMRGGFLYSFVCDVRIVGNWLFLLLSLLMLHCVIWASWWHKLLQFGLSVHCHIQGWSLSSSTFRGLEMYLSSSFKCFWVFFVYCVVYFLTCFFLFFSLKTNKQKPTETSLSHHTPLNYFLITSNLLMLACYRLYLRGSQK